MNVSRGDVVLVDYPFSDQTGSKVRPALIVQAAASVILKHDEQGR
jgi:hypothetical protein